MAKATGKDHSQINLDIWGDEPFLDLTPAAQHLYFVLWTSPSLTYCGAGDWHPGRIAARARGWKPAEVEAAAAELSQHLFLLIDEDTGEFLIRSWIKHDGLYRTPNMAVSMANARADLASRILRGVVVFEVAKIHAREPELSGWKRDAVASMLTQKATDPATVAPFRSAVTLGVTPAATPPPTPDATLGVTHGLTPGLTHGLTVNPRDGVNPGANPGPTPAPTPAPISYLHNGGSDSPVGHQSDDPDPDGPPPYFCPAHPLGSDAPCLGCKDARKIRERWQREQQSSVAVAESQARLDEALERAQDIVDCDRCDDDGYIGTVVCAHREHASPETRAAAKAALDAAMRKPKSVDA